MRIVRFSRRRSASRPGVAAAELAICLPVFLLLVIASIEACSMIFLRHSLTIASYEGIRVAIDYDGTNQNVLSRCNELLAARRVNDFSISLNPANVATVTRGTPLTVTVSAVCDSNSIIPSAWFFGGRNMEVTTTMVKE